MTEPLTLSYLRVRIVGADYVLTLRERELDVLVQARALQQETEVVWGAGWSAGPATARA